MQKGKEVREERVEGKVEETREVKESWINLLLGAGQEFLMFHTPLKLIF